MEPSSSLPLLLLQICPLGELEAFLAQPEQVVLISAGIWDTRVQLVEGNIGNATRCGSV